MDLVVVFAGVLLGNAFTFGVAYCFWQLNRNENVSANTWRLIGLSLLVALTGFAIR